MTCARGDEVWIGAQVQRVALDQLWSLLEAENQTEAVVKLESLRATALAGGGPPPLVVDLDPRLAVLLYEVSRPRGVRATMGPDGDPYFDVRVPLRARRPPR